MCVVVVESEISAQGTETRCAL